MQWIPFFTVSAIFGYEVVHLSGEDGVELVSYVTYKSKFSYWIKRRRRHTATDVGRTCLFNEDKISRAACS